MSTDAAHNHATSSSPSSTPAPSIEALEVTLEVQRAQLARDLEELGSRLAPASLKRQAATTARDAASHAQHSVVEAAVSLKDSALEAATSLRERVEDALMAPSVRSASPSPRRVCPVRTLLSDAAAGDRRSLAVATVGVVLLAGVSALAVTKASRLVRP